MKEDKKISFKERLKTEFQENSMLYKFYMWLHKKNNNPRDKNTKVSCISFVSFLSVGVGVLIVSSLSTSTIIKSLMWSI